MKYTSRSRYFDFARAELHPTKFSHLMTEAVPVPGAMMTPPNSGGTRPGIIRRNYTGDRITPIFMAHPHYDETVPYSETLLAMDVFRAMGWEEINWENYPHDNGSTQEKHWLNVPLGIDHLAQWLSGKLRNCPFHPRGGHVHDHAIQNAIQDP
ncbi:hypothetical protein Daus18300_011194 [Diaporthe australafricana]|uniref:Uncharacterized protein n=1 Tax=Diaporthe australafricana TaxID=127596 RepID=A0ABR3W7B9_9PEZI